MPLTEKGEKIKNAMQQEYGPEKGERVLYASANKGTISGIHDQMAPTPTPPASAPGTAPAPTPPVPSTAVQDEGMVTSPNAGFPQARRPSMGFGGGKDRGAFGSRSSGSQSFNWKGRSV